MTQPAQSQPDSAPKAWWQTDAAFVAGTILVTLCIAWGMARYELVSRARTAYLKGEQYYGWYHDPAAKKAYFDAELAAGHLTADQVKIQMEDNDLKNAYVWYETVLDLFQPPRSQWVEKSEERMKEVKPLYDAWLRSMGIEPLP